MNPSRFGTTVLLAAAVLAAGSPAGAQGEVRARVLIMVDTSGSMLWHMSDNASTGGDGTVFYRDALMTRSLATNLNQGLFVGSDLTPICPGSGVLTDYDGWHSRLYTAKTALEYWRTADPDVELGLMRYSGTVCAFDSAIHVRPCSVNADCGTGMVCSGGGCYCNGNTDCTSGACDLLYGATGLCRCTSDEQCRRGDYDPATPHFSYSEYCLDDPPAGGSLHCAVDLNLCQFADLQTTDRRPAYNGSAAQAACGAHDIGGIDFASACGTSAAAGAPACATPQACASDGECAAGSCALIGAGPARSCTCGTPGDCPTGYTCAGGRCVYDRACVASGGTVLVDPGSAGAHEKIGQWVDGIDDFRDDGAAQPINPELRGVGPRPLAGAIRAATAWYDGIETGGLDPHLLCRPYVLALVATGDDECEAGAGGDALLGPVAAARGFVAATAPGARFANKVYVVGLSSSAGANHALLDAIAAAGGTGSARFADDAVQLESAVGEAVALSQLGEQCNGQDDDCDGSVDEGCAPGPSDLFPLTPCRVIDTRCSGPSSGCVGVFYGFPSLAAGAQRTYTIPASACGVPADAQAIVFNATAIGASGAGSCSLAPAGIGPPPIRTVHYLALAARANNGVLGVENGTGRLAVRCEQSSGKVDLILDVTGYFR